MIITLLCIGILKLARDEPQITKVIIKLGMWSGIVGYIILIIFKFPSIWRLIWLLITYLLIIINFKLDKETIVEDDPSDDESTVED